MSAPTRKARPYHPADPRCGGTMSFAEIGYALQISAQGAAKLYSSGMRKLRARPVVLARLQVMASQLAAMREARERGLTACGSVAPGE